MKIVRIKWITLNAEIGKSKKIFKVSGKAYGSWWADKNCNRALVLPASLGAAILQGGLPKGCLYHSCSSFPADTTHYDQRLEFQDFLWSNL